MCGRAYSPRFLFIWPNAKISVMGGEQAANVLLNVAKNLHPEKYSLFKQQTIEKFELESSSYFSTARIWDDGIIEPTQTRKVIGLCLEACLYTQSKSKHFGVFRM